MNLLLAGAKRHAKDVLTVLQELKQDEEIFLFDDYSKGFEDSPATKNRILTDLGQAEEFFKKHHNFILACGGPVIRKSLSEKLQNAGGRMQSLIAPSSIIGTLKVSLGQGLNIMHHVFISNYVNIGEGVLLNSGVALHHDVEVGDWTEISPGARVLGGVKIGALCSIGAGAVILPDVRIGNGVVVGAGAVVTKDVNEGLKVAGIPAVNMIDR